MKTHYYETEVDRIPDSYYIYQGSLGEDQVFNHRHDKTQFLYTEGGMVYVTVARKTYFLPSRHFMLIPAKTAHSIKMSSEKVIMRNIYFPVQKRENRFYRKTAIYPANDLVLNLLVYLKKFEGDIPVSNVSEMTVAKSFKYLLSLSEGQEIHLSLPYPKSKILMDITEYMNRNQELGVTLRSISEKFGCSSRSITRMFRSDVSMSFIEYFTILRILKSIDLLIGSNFSIKEICSKVGYNSVPTFSTMFLKIMGMRPNEYRKMRNVLAQ